MEYPPEQDPWKATARALGEKAAAARLAQDEAAAERARQRDEAQQRTSEGERRIDEFLDRMRDAGDPGCTEYDLSIPGRRDKMIRRRAEIGEPFRDEDPDELIVMGWIIEDRSHRAHPRDSASERGDWCVSRTVLTTDGIAFDTPGRSPGGDFGRSRLDPAKVTMEMLVGTLTKNGVEV